MKPETRLLLIPLILAPLALPVNTALADDTLSAGSRHRCVPNADRTGWECSGSANATPAPEPAAEAVAEPIVTPIAEEPEPVAVAPVDEPSPPPPAMVAAPPDDAAPLSDFYRAVPDSEPTAAPLPETVMSEPQAISNADASAAPSEEPVASLPSEPVAAAEPETEPAPEPVSEPVTQPISEPVATAEPEPIAEPEPAPAEPAPSEPAPAAPDPVPAPVASSWSLNDLSNAQEFARLNGNAYTLQLADAGSADGFPRLIAELGLAPASCYVLKVKRDGQDWWLLAHGEFADANAAKQLLARLPNVPGLTRNWPRKIQYLQREFGNAGP